MACIARENRQNGSRNAVRFAGKRSDKKTPKCKEGTPSSVPSLRHILYNSRIYFAGAPIGCTAPLGVER